MSHDHLFENALRFPMARAAGPPEEASRAIVHQGRREWSVIVSLNR